MLFSIYASLLGQLSADFTGLLTYTAFAFDMPAEGLGKAFPGVTPSFHLLDYQFFRALVFTSLSIALRLTFSVRNESHKYHLPGP